MITRLILAGLARPNLTGQQPKHAAKPRPELLRLMLGASPDLVLALLVSAVVIFTAACGVLGLIVGLIVGVKG